MNRAERRAARSIIAAGQKAGDPAAPRKTGAEVDAEVGKDQLVAALSETAKTTLAAGELLATHLYAGRGDDEFLNEKFAEFTGMRHVIVDALALAIDRAGLTRLFARLTEELAGEALRETIGRIVDERMLGWEAQIRNAVAERFDRAAERIVAEEVDRAVREVRRRIAGGGT